MSPTELELIAAFSKQTEQLNIWTQEFDAYQETRKHIDLVIRYLLSAQFELSKRAVTHDRTKLETPEREMFGKMTHKLRGLAYGSPEYKQCLSEMKALPHHYAHNRHHPEYFQKREESSKIKGHEIMVNHAMNYNVVLPDDIYGYENLAKFLQTKQAEHTSSVNNMNLFDLFEMFIDWTVTCQRHADGDINKSIEINTARFGLSPQLVEILKNTIPWVQDAFKGLNNQKDIQPPSNI